MWKRRVLLAYLIVASTLALMGTGPTLVNLATQVFGTLPSGSFPAMAGDVTNTAGSLTNAIGTGKVSRLKEGADGKPWQYLGIASTGVSAITVGPLIWTATCQEFQFHYIISGYSGGAVGRFLTGGSSITNSGATNATSFSEGVTTPSTLTGAAGVPLAVTISAIGREGWIWVYGPNGSLKEIDVMGQNGSPSTSTAPTLFRAASFFSDLGSNPTLQRAQLSVYPLTTGSAISTSITFNGGTSLEGWCRNGD